MRLYLNFLNRSFIEAILVQWKGKKCTRYTNYILFARMHKVIMFVFNPNFKNVRPN